MREQGIPSPFPAELLGKVHPQTLLKHPSSQKTAMGERQKAGMLSGSLLLLFPMLAEDAEPLITWQTLQDPEMDLNIEKKKVK